MGYPVYEAGAASEDMRQPPQTSRAKEFGCDNETRSAGLTFTDHMN